MRLRVRQRPILVPGFDFSGVSCGIKERSVKDLALVTSEVPAVSAAVFTNNSAAAPPVLLGRRIMRRGYLQALIINSGNANAGTGRAGRAAALKTCEQVAQVMNIPRTLVLPASTGKIGSYLPDLGEGIVKAARALSPRGFWTAASAIMTTDAFPKAGLREVRIDGRKITLAAMAKGAGMIAPRMATLLAFFFTDAAMTVGASRELVERGIAPVFNGITVEGDTSTNDTAVLMANGAAGNRPITRSSRAFCQFLAAVVDLAEALSVLVVSDGEGATRLIEVAVTSAKSRREAELVARAIAESVLVRTAVFGGDPNWGRLLAAAGNAGVRINPDKVRIAVGGIRLFDRGCIVGPEARQQARKSMKRRRVLLSVDLGSGGSGGRKRAEAKVLTCDLSPGYVHFNSSYTT